MGEGPQKHGDSKGLLQEADVLRVVRTVAEKLGVLAEFDDVISGKRAVRALLDGVDLARAEHEAREVLVGVGSSPQDADDAGMTREAHAVFREESTRSTESADEYAFDIGQLEYYKHCGNVDRYSFCYKDGRAI
eukprot:jgi/Antlo1/1983/1623